MKNSRALFVFKTDTLLTPKFGSCGGIFKLYNMKKMFSFLCLLTVAVIASAQSSTAVLSHNGEIKTFYGEDALRNAHAEAVAGDVITLSSGRFNGGNFYITKPITVRGVGNDIQYDGDTTQIEPTIITSQIQVRAEADTTHCVTLEGLKMAGLSFESSNYADVQVIKCNLNGDIYASGHGSLSITQSLCYGRFSTGDISLSAVSSYFADIYFSYIENEQFQKIFQNCVLSISSIGNRCTTIKNSIISRSSSVTFSVHLTDALIYNSLIIRGGFNGGFTGGYNNSSQFHDFLVDSDSGIFKDGTLFELTDNAKTLYYGSDGKQVGMYGGVLPFNPVPSYPRITTFNVAPQTTADGKLSIDIVVK